MTIILLLKEHNFYTKRFQCFLNWRPRALKGHARATRQKGEKEGRKGRNGEKGRLGEGKRKEKRKKKGYSLLTSFVRSSEKSLPWEWDIPPGPLAPSPRSVASIAPSPRTRIISPPPPNHENKSTPMTQTNYSYVGQR